VVDDARLVPVAEDPWACDVHQRTGRVGQRNALDDRAGLVAEPVLDPENQVSGMYPQQRLPAKGVEGGPVVGGHEHSPPHPAPLSASYQSGDVALVHAERARLGIGDETALAGHRAQSPGIHRASVTEARCRHARVPALLGTAGFPRLRVEGARADHALVTPCYPHEGAAMRAHVCR